MAFAGLPWMIAALNFLVYMLAQVDRHKPEDPSAYLHLLDLNWTMILQGQVWRLITFIFIPSFFGGPLSLFWLILYLLFIIFVGNTLEQHMGAFRLNVYYLLGMIGVIAAAYISHRWDPAANPAEEGQWGNPILNSSLFFAMAWYVPDATIYFMYVIPVKVKWMAWISAVLLGFQFVVGALAMKLAMLVALGNYIIFFGPEIIHRSRERAGVSDRRSRFHRQVEEAQGEALHMCAVCRRTELDSPHLDFRVARDGEEYCVEHLPKPPAATAG
jgi:hypothetical protein